MDETRTQDGPGRPTVYPSRLEELEEEALRREAENSELRGAYARSRDEHRSRVQRLERDLDQRLDRAAGDMVEGLLDVLDNLDLAIQSAASATDAEAVAEGVRMVRDMFLQVMARMGLERVITLDAPYDPHLAEAVGVEEVEDPSRDGLVLAEHRPGYVFRGRVLRPANVVVGRHAGASSSPPAPAPEAEETAVQPASEPDAGVAAAGSPEDGPIAEDTWLETGEMPPPAGGEPESYRPIPPEHEDPDPEDGPEEGEDEGAAPGSPADVRFDEEDPGPEGSGNDLDWED